MVSGIYLILCLANNRYYVGSAIDFDDRWRLHLIHFRNGNHHNRHIQRAYNKHGEISIQFFILEFTTDLEVREQYWIDQLDATNRLRGYNICKAGRNRYGVKASDETRRKLSESHKGWKHSAETKAKMSASKIGNTINNGRKWSAEVIARRVASNIGKKRTPEQIERMQSGRNRNKKPVSAETRLKQSIAAKNRRIKERLQKSVKANDGTLDYKSDMWV